MRIKSPELRRFHLSFWEAACALAALGIRTIFDLGASNLFASARAVVAVSQTGTPDARFGMVAGDLSAQAAMTANPSNGKGKRFNPQP